MCTSLCAHFSAGHNSPLTLFLKFLRVIPLPCRVGGIPVVTGAQLSTQAGAGGPAEYRAVWCHLLTYTMV